jgi:peptide/nickel transport system substrate-binding protein
MLPRLSLLLIVPMLLAACAPVTSPQSQGTQDSQPAPERARSGPKAIAVGMDEEIKSFWDSITLGGGSGSRELANVFNAHLVAITADGSPTPRLLTELPSVERGTWRVQPDGGMETTFKLRPDAFWHDGTPFSAEDVAFSLQVNRDPEVPNSNQDAVRLVESWQVTDPNTIVVRWKESYAFADRMEHRDLYPLPKHLLEQSYMQGPKENFTAQPYFNTDYIGLGPFRVNRWDPGSSIDFQAFDKYFLGRPKLDSIRIQFIADPNTMVGNLQARAIQMMLTLGGIPEFSSMVGVKRDWEASGYGTILMDPISYRFLEYQIYHSPSPTDLRDPRVRRALLLALDRPALTRVAFADDGVVADSWVNPKFPYYPQVQDVIVKWPYDPRQASQLMTDAGWTMASDGVLEKAGQKFSMTMRDTDGERDPLVLAGNWKDIGVQANYERRTTAALRDREDRATFTGVDVSSNPMGVAAVIRKSATYNIPTAENRWTGTNRGGYSNPAWDEVEPRIVSSLDERQRLDFERQLLSMYATDLPLGPLYFRWDMVPVGGGVKGPVPNTGVAHRGFILHTWNVHEWDIP